MANQLYGTLNARPSTYSESSFSSTIANEELSKPVRGIELMTRHSIYSIASKESDSEDQTKDKWTIKELKVRFERNEELFYLYKKYQELLMMKVNLKSYLILQVIISLSSIAIFLLANIDNEEKAVAEIISNIALICMACICYLWINDYFCCQKRTAFKVELSQQSSTNNTANSFEDLEPQKNEKYRTSEQYKCQALDRIFSGTKCKIIILNTVIVVFLIGTDFALGTWFMIRNSDTQTQGSHFYIPAALYTIIIVYNILPIRSLWCAVLLGGLVSTAHICYSSFFFQPNMPEHKTDVEMVFADIAFYLGANLMGIFTKSLNEITLRRAFLDKRKCIETTLKLNYEKTQEEKLMLSILPEHIASKVSQDIWEEVQALQEKNKTSNQSISHKPFNHLYVETHQGVSILYADVVNFTPLTASLHPANLVSMLNVLFGKFDNAAKANNCLRIKILGDCYYCVSGIYRENALTSSSCHNLAANYAKNCVEMGFTMIDIIRDVRDDYHVDVDMRIGIHTGSIISGLLGFRKWQYDIWSQDVTIANHMEQSGQPGRVHVSMSTKLLLEDIYDFEEGYGKEKDDYLKQHNIHTFLVKRKNENHLDEINLDYTTIQFEAETHNPTLSISNEEYQGQSPECDEFSLSSLYDVLPESLPTSFLHPRSSLNWRLSSEADESQGSNKVHKPFESGEPHEELSSRFLKSSSKKSSVVGGTQREIEKVKRRSTNNNEARRGAVWMDTALRDMLTKANEAMEDAISNMQLSKIHQQGKSDGKTVNFCLFFGKRSWEIPFLTRPDHLFPFYIIGALPVTFAVLTIQTVLFNHNVPPHFWWIFSFTIGVFLATAIVLWRPWLHYWLYLGHQFFKCHLFKSEQPDDVSAQNESYSDITRNNSKDACFTSKNVKNSLMWRIVIFLLICISVDVFCISSVNVITTSQQPVNSTTFSGCYYKDSRIYIWYFTYSCALAMTVVFSFYRINFIMKLCVYIFATATYSAVLQLIYPKICDVFLNHDDCLLCSTSFSTSPELAHILYLVRILLLLHVVDRQIEFIHRLDYIWQQQLVVEKKKAYTTRTVNKLLLHNILPLHVAELYLDQNKNPRGLYHEDYEAVAVMFAAIPYYMETFGDSDTEEERLRSLEILNEIISGFDALLYNKLFQRVEKIKIVGSTYMAACGLKAIKKGIENIEEDNEESPLMSLVTMVYFAVAMKKSLELFSARAERSFQLRVGISYGPVVAGVVGAEKPFYDIWGDTVNVASRLEYTGELGKIQITEDVAVKLDSMNITTVERGETLLKGKGLVKTFWVCTQSISFNESFSIPRPSTLSQSSSSAWDNRLSKQSE